MKSTTTTQIAKRIEKAIAAKQIRKGTIVHEWLQSIVIGKVINFRPVYTQGSSWKHSSLINKQSELAAALTAIKLSFTSGNDAPRGGKTGAFIRITTKIK
jgi:hypothetical protein